MREVILSFISVCSVCACGSTGTECELPGTGSVPEIHCVCDTPDGDVDRSFCGVSDAAQSKCDEKCGGHEKVKVTENTGIDCTVVGCDGGAERINEVCEKWLAVHKNLAEVKWTGSVAKTDSGYDCHAGTATDSDNAVTLLNLYRYLAQVDSVTHDTNMDSPAQQCALIEALLPLYTGTTPDPHYPPGPTASTEGTPCWTQNGYDAAGKANISGHAAVASIHRHIVDYSYKDTVPHRLWFLSRWADPVGVGSVGPVKNLSTLSDGTSDDKYASCITRVQGTPTDADIRKWTAWPPSGPVPSGVWDGMVTKEATKDAPEEKANINDVGWSWQTDRFNPLKFQNDSYVVAVSVTRAGKALFVAEQKKLGEIVNNRARYAGAMNAIKFTPMQGTEADHATLVTHPYESYHVSITITKPNWECPDGTARDSEDDKCDKNATPTDGKECADGFPPDYLGDGKCKDGSTTTNVIPFKYTVYVNGCGEDL